MDIEQALRQTAPGKNGPTRNIDKLLAAMDPEEAANTRTALRDPQIQQTHLGRALTLVAREKGVLGSQQSINGQAVGRWREANGHH